MRYIITALMASTALPALADVPAVITDIPPVHSLVAQVMGDLGAPVLLLEKGASEHGFQLRPSQAAAVAGADLVVWIGPELTPWLDRALETRDPTSAALALLDAPGTLTRGYDEPHATHEDHATEGHDQEHEAESHDHDHEGTDPHAWLDPANGKLWLGLIAAELARLDPENAATYAANAEAAAREIDALDAEVTAILAPVKDRPIVLFHDAYSYFADHYGLAVAGTIALGDASSPGAQRLDALRTTVSAGGAVCLFPEVQHDPALVAQIADGTAARIGGSLDPVGSSLEPGPAAYAALLGGLARTLADCAGK
ncbi:MAG: zinc ABC transporter solute-binding protein [Tabrizicola sp.]|nr:zinc ABC transporter solute-binding protein [Tabrizicola sp.]